ncbi:MAG: elongation factor Ts [bacterium]|nr:elongation factor Ts [bacterium]MCP5068966.1 elongation factor Ts [bacterium]
MVAVSASDVKALRDRTGAGMMDCKKALSEAEGDVDKAIEMLRERGLAKAVKRSGRETSEGTIAMALDGQAAGLVELGCETDFVAKTDNFQALATGIAAAAAANPDAAGSEALGEIAIDGEKIADRISSAVGTLGENIQLKRSQRLAVGSGHVGGYIHAGGKLGVLVALETTASGDAVEGLAKDLAMHVAAADPSPVGVDRDSVPKDLIDKEAELFRRQAEQDGKPAQVIEKIVEGRIRKYYGEVCLLEQPFVKDPDKTIQALTKEVGEAAGSSITVAGFIRFKLGENVSE